MVLQLLVPYIHSVKCTCKTWGRNTLQLATKVFTLMPSRNHVAYATRLAVHICIMSPRAAVEFFRTSFLERTRFWLRCVMGFGMDYTGDNFDVLCTLLAAARHLTTTATTTSCGFWCRHELTAYFDPSHKTHPTGSSEKSDATPRPAALSLQAADTSCSCAACCLL